MTTEQKTALPLASPAKTRVSLVALDGYDDDARVAKALADALAPFGGMAGIVRPGDRVLLKANLLAPAKPDEAVTSHPAIVRAVIREAKSAGASRVLVGDSPGVGTTRETMRACGILQVVEEEGAEMASFDHVAVFERLENTLGKRLELTEHLLETDVLITLPKLKTHVQMGYTGALKNQFGLVVGTRKAQYHFRFQNRDRLADLMIDINRTAKVKLAILDAVVAMEGPGPHGGRPRKIGALVVGTDLPAVDVVGCQLIGMDPQSYPLLQAAARAGYGTTEPADIEIVGERLEALRVPDFELVKAPANIMRILPLPGWMLRWLRRHIADRPRIDRSKCIRCLKCHNGCPVKPSAIDPRRQGDAVNHRTCIRCYCCHEFCPVNAIELRRSWVERIFHLKAIGAAGSWLVGKFAGICQSLTKHDKT
ncbi:MAG: DUF362 domain-containing protein [Victivallales bacterium]|nr:DUF362 domain-containing protein [Victivallales bacterium]